MNIKAVHIHKKMHINRILLVLAMAIIAFVLLSPQTVSAAEYSRPKSMVFIENIPTVVLHAAKDSNELPVIPLPGQQVRKRGDADGNGEVNYMDALLVLRHSVGLEQLSDSVVTRCDVDCSGDLSYMDALIILRYSIGLITCL